LKILIIRFSSIGDIVLTTPVIRIAHEQLGAEIHVLTKKKYAFVLANNPHVARLHQLDRNFSGLMHSLRKERFDLILDLHHNLRTLRVKSSLRRPSRSFFKANWEKWLMVNFKINRLPKKHIVDRYLETLRDFPVRNDGKGLDFFHGIRSLPVLNSLPENYLCISLGAAHVTKQIPLTQLMAMVKTKKAPYVLIGGKDVEETGKKLSAACDQVFDLTGKLSLAESAYVIEKSAGLITGDTGMMHIGAALKKKMVVLWGNTIPEFGMGPYYGTARVMHRNMEIGLACRPCSKTGFNKCPKGHFRCMLEHDMNHLIQDTGTLFGV
jgi:heptosyltransferase-2